MPRTIVYATAKPPSDVAFRDSASPREQRPMTQEAQTAGAPDGYAEKLAKYVPAEVLAFFGPMAALLADSPKFLLSVAGVALLATPGYLWRMTRSLPPAKRPLRHFYFLASISFAVWAIATTSLGSLIGIDPRGSSALLGVTIFLLPLVDAFLADKLG